MCFYLFSINYYFLILFLSNFDLNMFYVTFGCLFRRVWVTLPVLPICGMPLFTSRGENNHAGCNVTRKFSLNNLDYFSCFLSLCYYFNFNYVQNK